MAQTMTKTASYAAKKEKAPLEPFTFQRRDLRPHDVKIDILYCGVCHSDLHIVKNEWKNTVYPVVPGHEIIGRVSEVGNQVKAFKVGQIVAVGCLVDSCRDCPDCHENLEQYCDGLVLTYNGKDKIDGTTTYGGYSTNIVVDEKFVLRVPEEFKEKDLPAVAPLLCAGITTYSPLRHWKVGKDSRVGVAGIGGLGHMAIKLAHAMGAHVVVFTSSESKIPDAKKLGADEVVVTKKPEALKKFTGSLDFIINTIAASHNLDDYLTLLKRDGTMCLLGAPEHPHSGPSIRQLIFKRRQLAGSLIGGLKETQEMLDFCAKKGVLAEIELIPIQKINEAYERMLKNDVKYRFVIDISTLPREKID
jgi:alcohol dehydrogenase (NADP+)